MPAPQSSEVVDVRLLLRHDDAYELATEAMVCNLMSEDAREGIDAFTQKRRPQWKGK